jgi:hypothetical protein
VICQKHVTKGLGVVLGIESLDTPIVSEEPEPAHNGIKAVDGLPVVDAGSHQGRQSPHVPKLLESNAGDELWRDERDRHPFCFALECFPLRLVRRGDVEMDHSPRAHEQGSKTGIQNVRRPSVWAGGRPAQSLRRSGRGVCHVSAGATVIPTQHGEGLVHHVETSAKILSLLLCRLTRIMRTDEECSLGVD